jgi:hypothetical protein
LNRRKALNGAKRLNDWNVWNDIRLKTGARQSEIINSARVEKGNNTLDFRVLCDFLSFLGQLVLRQPQTALDRKLASDTVGY